MKNNGLFYAFLQNVFPKRCVSCDSIINGGYLCKNCEKIERITVKVCAKCGLTVTECDCKYNAFNFDAVIAPFYNYGIAQSVVYRMKFQGSSDSINFVAKEMISRLKDKCDNIAFDAVCCVPMHPLHRIKRGYNQSADLAKIIAKELRVPYNKNLLKNLKNSVPQHKLSLTDRFENVRGRYVCTARVDNMRILLVDDIRTSGATLNECARQLKLNGAGSVVCCVAAITQNYIEKAYKN